MDSNTSGARAGLAGTSASSSPSLLDSTLPHIYKDLENVSSGPAPTAGTCTEFVLWISFVNALF